MTALLPRPTASRAPATGRPLPRPEPLTRLPILLLEVHSRCNCRCRMCDIWRGSERRQLDPDLVRRSAAAWRAFGVERVVLTGGEPLLHARLWDICAALREAQIDITLLTTGLLLQRDAERVVEFCDDVVVSLDGPREIHDRIRGITGAFGRIADGIAALRAAETPSGGRPAISISARCTVQRENCGALRATVRAARELGLDRISFLAVDTHSEAFDRPGGWTTARSAEVAVDGSGLDILRRELDALEAEHGLDFASGFIAESPDKLRLRLLSYFAGVSAAKPLPPNRCNAPWVSAVLQIDGSVRPCFFHKPVGNVREAGSLSDVVNGERAAAFRRALDVTTDPICRRCVCTLALEPRP